MELKQLEYFMTLSQELHFTRAAEKLGITQPSLSLIDGSNRSNLLHNLTFTAVSADGQPASNDLAKTGKIRDNSYSPCAP